MEYGGHFFLIMDWAQSLLIRMGYVNRKATTRGNTKLQEDEFLFLKGSYLQETVAIVRVHNIPPILLINLDETGLQLVPVEYLDYGSRGKQGSRGRKFRGQEANYYHICWYN